MSPPDAAKRIHRLAQEHPPRFPSIRVTYGDGNTYIQIRTYVHAKPLRVPLTPSAASTHLCPALGQVPYPIPASRHSPVRISELRLASRPLQIQIGMAHSCIATHLRRTTCLITTLASLHFRLSHTCLIGLVQTAAATILSAGMS